ncbi:DUF995 domain-containing protein [Variovorax sp. J22R24]|uniref:DUF995 domain-containing protein n=1 Tax=Variovorax gracilis TaxID=3053502 RepID=UPI002574B461|nr:DUF995 domain-containing protein [Variovorax sp. J22R24]MDM0107698.1 DUF995 domain-containing protein [Variovorax sp. J22R24]
MLTLPRCRFPSCMRALGSRLVGFAGMALAAGGCATGGSSIQLTSVTGDDLVREGKILSAGELNGLARPGTVLVRLTPNGAVQRWTSGADGTFVAQTTMTMEYGRTPTTGAWGHGRWALHDKTYCLHIDWITKDNGKVATEKSCYAVYRMDARLFMAPENMTPSMKAERYGEVRFGS